MAPTGVLSSLKSCNAGCKAIRVHKDPRRMRCQREFQAELQSKKSPITKRNAGPCDICR